MLRPATPALHRAQLFTFAQGREYKKAMLPWGGLDGTQIPVVKNKTLRKAGSQGCVRTGGGVASAELESSTEKTPVCSTLWFCIQGAEEGGEGCAVQVTVCKEAETRLMCDAGQGEGSCHGLTIRPCRCSLGAPLAAPWGGEIPFE